MRDYSTCKNDFLSPGKRRNVLIVVVLAVVICIPLIAFAATGFFRDDSSAVSGASDSNGEVSFSTVCGAILGCAPLVQSWLLSLYTTFLTLLCHALLTVITFLSFLDAACLAY